jgi:hypothetical protein
MASIQTGRVARGRRGSTTRSTTGSTTGSKLETAVIDVPRPGTKRRSPSPSESESDETGSPSHSPSKGAAVAHLQAQMRLQQAELDKQKQQLARLEQQLVESACQCPPDPGCKCGEKDKAERVALDDSIIHIERLEKAVDANDQQTLENRTRIAELERKISILEMALPSRGPAAVPIPFSPLPSSS